MSERRRNVLIGVFVLGGLAALAILVIKFGEEPQWFGRRYVVSAIFDRVAGVREGTQVELAGIGAGSVSAMRLLNPENPGEGVVVEMQIDREVSVPTGSVARVVTPIGVGQSRINIAPPRAATDFVSKDGAGAIRGEITNPLESVIDPRFMASLEKTTTQIGTLAQALTPAANAVTDILQRRSIEQVESPDAAAKKLTANLYTAVERLYVLLTHMDQVIGNPEVQSGLKETITNLRLASERAVAAVEKFNQFGDDARQTAAKTQAMIAHVDETVHTTHQQISELGTKLQGNSDQLSQAMEYLVAAGRQLAEGKGTLGLLLRDSRFYEELLLTVERLKAAAQDLQLTVKEWQTRGFPVKLR